MYSSITKDRVQDVSSYISVQYIPRNMLTVLLCFDLLWLCNRSYWFHMKYLSIFIRVALLVLGQSLDFFSNKVCPLREKFVSGAMLGNLIDDMPYGISDGPFEGFKWKHRHFFYRLTYIYYVKPVNNYTIKKHYIMYIDYNCQIHTANWRLST